MKSPEQFNPYTVEEAQEEAIKMVERIKKGKSKDYNEASRHLDNAKKHNEWLLELHEKREENPEEVDGQLFSFQWEDEGGRFELSKDEIDWLCQEIKQAGEGKEIKTKISIDKRGHAGTVEFLDGVYGSQDVYRIFCLLDRVFGKEAKEYNLSYGVGSDGYYLELLNRKNENND